MMNSEKYSISTETIIAPITGPHQGAVALLRISGSNAFKITNRYFNNANFLKGKGFRIYLGDLTNESDQIIDEVLISKFRAPNSYTSEDTVEISCHASPYIVNEIIQLYLRNGARLAKRGEFSFRAFINGKLDLSQAEAVSELIASQSELTHSSAIKQLKGQLSMDIQLLRQKLIELASLLELELDFSEEDVTFADRASLIELIKELRIKLEILLSDFKLGNAIKKGIQTALIGKPNSGKSTLLNVLTKDDRAIVSSIPGTTRDSIEVVVNINGVHFNIIDTAGLRVSSDIIEQKGIERTQMIISKADLVLLVIDSKGTTKNSILEQIAENKLDKNKLIIVLNKYDLEPIDHDLFDDFDQISISGLQKLNISALKEKMLYKVTNGKKINDNSVWINQRHFESITKTLNSLSTVENGLLNKVPSDLVSVDLKRALHYLGEISGEIHTDDLLDSIFSNFCIGK